MLTALGQDAKAVQNKRAYIELSTQKSGTFFTTSDLKDLAEDYAEHTKVYETTQRGLVKEIVGIAGG